MWSQKLRELRKLEGDDKKAELEVSESTCNPVRNKPDMLHRTAEEEIHLWRDHQSCKTK